MDNLFDGEFEWLLGWRDAQHLLACLRILGKGWEIGCLSFLIGRKNDWTNQFPVKSSCAVMEKFGHLINGCIFMVVGNKKFKCSCQKTTDL